MIMTIDFITFSDVIRILSVEEHYDLCSIENEKNSKNKTDSYAVWLWA